jgi:F-type H+-transporting ATPase subunit gamma
VPNLRDIRGRIKSIRSTQQITRAMKMVAGARLRRAQETALTSRPFSQKLAEVLNSVVGRVDLDAHPLFRPRPSRRLLVVVVSSDRGLCGGFNTNLCKHVAQYVAERQAEGRDVELYTIGRRGRDYFRRRRYAIRREKLNVFAKLAFGRAKQIADELVEMFLADEVGEVVLVFNEFKSVLAPRVVVEALLPIPRPAATGLAAPIDYLYEPEPESILRSLVPWHVDTQLWRVLMESNAAEQAARVNAMDTATKNAGELIENLTLTMNKARQAAITKELLEVMSGADALGA